MLATPLLAYGSVARANDSWTGAQDTDWFNGSNWTAGTAPSTKPGSSTGDATIENTSDTTTPVIDSSRAGVSTLVVGSGRSPSLNSGGLIIQNGGGLDFKDFNAKWSLVIAGNNPTVTASDSIETGIPTISANSIMIGAASAASNQGNGNLNILDSAIVSIHDLSMGSNISTPSTLKISGPGARLLVDGALKLGGSVAQAAFLSTTSVIEVSNGGRVIADEPVPGQDGATVTSLHDAVLTVTGLRSTASILSSDFLGTHARSGIRVLDGERSR